MSLAHLFDHTEEQTSLQQQYATLIKNKPALRQRDAAEKLNISESESVHEQLGVTSIKLRPAFKDILNDLPALGYIMNLTRNAFAVHERKGCYQNINFNGPMVLVISDDKKIDLRLFLMHWAHVYAVRQPTNSGERYSLQFFNHAGVAIQKIFLQPDSDIYQFEQLIEKYHDKNRHTAIDIHTETEENVDNSDNDVDIESFTNDWKNMKDVHEFFGLLRKYGMSSQQAFHLRVTDYAEQFSASHLQAILEDAASGDITMMCFVGNKVSIQIFSGNINRVKRLEEWLNILDPEFNLHLMTTGIDDAWLVRKPTFDGIVTSLELYDTNGNQIVQFFGKGIEGYREHPDWKQLAESALARQH